MIIIYHKRKYVTDIWDVKKSEHIPFNTGSISGQLLKLAESNPNELLLWCHEACRNQLNVESIASIFHSKDILASYRVSKAPYLTNAIGYVNETPFINVNKKVLYPTWLMSSDVGGVYAKALLGVKEGLVLETNFDYFLNSIAKLAMPLGMFCYSAPKLLKRQVDIETHSASKITLFKFVKQHYKTIWVFLLFINLVVYEKKFPVMAMLLSLFYKRKHFKKESLTHVKSDDGNAKDIENINLDVVIPTIGRKQYLCDTLNDLAKQTLLPKQVIIVEQNPDLNTKSALDFLNTKAWPFKIQHHFTHQAGACNARNIALNEIKSEWVFLADDDIVLKNDFIEEASKVITNSKQKAFTFRCYLKDEALVFKTVKQWETFGSGCSIVKAKAIENLRFDMGFEFGFGEDADFGMQIRNKGIDVIYLPEPSILHLKAPMGGFRTKPKLLWQNDKVQPKPSPTISLLLKKHFTTQQILGYKTTLFLKYYRVQNIKNPFKYYKTFGKQWKRSHYWANQLMQKQG